MKTRYLAALVVLAAFTAAYLHLPGVARATFMWNGLEWDYNTSASQLYDKVGADTIYAEVYQNVGGYEVLVSDLDGIDAGEQSFTASNIADFSYIDILFPTPEEHHYARVPRSKLTGPFASTFYALSVGGDLYRYTITGNATTSLGDLSTSLSSFSELMSFNGGLYALRNEGSIYEIDIDAASISTAIMDLGTGNNWVSIEAHNGTVYSLQSNGGFSSVNLVDKTRSSIASLGTPTNWIALASHSGTMYACTATGELFTVNVTNGTSSAVGSGFGSTNWESMTSHDETLYVVRRSNELHSINTSNGTSTLVNDINITGANQMRAIVSHRLIPRIHETLLAEISGTSIELCVQEDLDWIEVHGIP